MKLQNRKLLLIVLPTAMCAVLIVVWWQRSTPDSRYRAAVIAMEAGDYSHVAEAIKELRSHPGSKSRVHYLTAAYLLHSGDPEAAMKTLSSFEPDDETRIPALLLGCESCYRLGRLMEAEAAARKLIQEQSDNAEAHRWLAAVYYDLGANEAALTQLARLSKLSPDDFKPHRLMALMHHDFRQHAEAIEHYRKALALSPPLQIREEIHSELATSLVAQRKYAQAVKVLDNANNSALNYALRSECRWSLGETQQAWSLLEEAKKIDPDERAALLLEARMGMSEGNPDLAVIALERRLQRDPHDAECRYQLANAFRQLGQMQEFEREMTKWRTANGLLDRLTELSKEAIRKPNDREIRTQIAEVCDQLGKHELAESWRRAAGAYRQPAGPSTSNSNSIE